LAIGAGEQSGEDVDPECVRVSWSAGEEDWLEMSRLGCESDDPAEPCPHGLGREVLVPDVAPPGQRRRGVDAGHAPDRLAVEAGSAPPRAVVPFVVRNHSYRWGQT
jgi:hypothetical protein